MKKLGVVMMLLAAALFLGSNVGAAGPPADSVPTVETAPPEALDLSHPILCPRGNRQCICERACTWVYESCLSGINPLQCEIEYSNCLDNCVLF